MAMPIEIHEGGTTITGKDGIAFYRMAALKGALSLEIKGLRMRRGVSAYAIIKREFGLRGSRERVLEAFTRLVEEKSATITRILDCDACRRGDCTYHAELLEAANEGQP
jgi:hypothetical protein